MSRKLRRVPLDFNWPRNKTWEGFLNPYVKLSGKCASCDGSGYSPMAKTFKDQWYGYGGFDPVVYGAKPLTVDHPAVQAFARRNVEQNPGFYFQFHGQSYYGLLRHAAGNKSAEEIDKLHLELTIAREAERLFSLWRNMWSHHLIQADVDVLVAQGRLWDLTGRPAEGESVPAPTADQVNDWSMRGFGHDTGKRAPPVHAL